jgi:hypothetical protein
MDKEAQEKIRQEKRELDEKRLKLANFITSDDFNLLETQDKTLLERQAEAMNDYAGVLGGRIARFKD